MTLVLRESVLAFGGVIGMSRTCIGGCGRGLVLLDFDLDFGAASLLLRLRFPAFLLGDSGSGCENRHHIITKGEQLCFLLALVLEQVGRLDIWGSRQ